MEVDVDLRRWFCRWRLTFDVDGDLQSPPSQRTLPMVHITRGQVTRGQATQYPKLPTGRTTQSLVSKQYLEQYNPAGFGVVAGRGCRSVVGLGIQSWIIPWMD